MRFVVLGSGSSGNALVVEAGGTRVLVDCGLRLKDLEARLAQADIDPSTIAAVLVTHEHSDHASGAGPFCRRYRTPLWCTHGTWRNGRFGELSVPHLFNPHGERFRVGAMEISPYPLPHDAAEPAHFVFAAEGVRLGLLTDAGTLSPVALAVLMPCDALFVESNHDPEMLRHGPYPPWLRARVGGDYGHLSNRQAASLLEGIDRPRLRQLVAGHLSEKNNTPAHVYEAILNAAPEMEGRFAIAGPDRATPWFDLTG